MSKTTPYNGRHLKQIAIVGRTPPPFGGVTVHIKRLVMMLEENVSIGYYLLDMSGRRSEANTRIINCKGVLRLAWALMITRYDATHCHVSNPIALMLVDFIVRCVRKKKTIYTLHGEGIIHMCEEKDSLFGLIGAQALKNASFVVVLNTICYNRAIRFVAPEKCAVISAYLPPSKSELVLSHETKRRISEFKSRHEYVVGLQGAFREPFEGQSVYQFCFFASAIKMLINEGYNVGVVLLVTQTQCLKERNAFFKQLDDDKLQEQWLILENEEHGAGVYKNCDAFIRPTITDGDSMSVRECLDIGIPVLASDAVPRPEGCHLFNVCDEESLINELKYLLDNREACKSAATEIATENNTGKKLLTIYERVLSNEWS